MKKLAVMLGGLLIPGLVIPATAAPLFPDVPDNHWARDAVSVLCAKGITEGYPDGTFKGDRAASRWELALLCARLLAKMESGHAVLATKAELTALEKLTSELRNELEALGVRLANLEAKTEKLDERVRDLETITFYGELQARITTQSFRNTGAGGIGADGVNPPLLDYTTSVGSAEGAGGIITAPSAAAGYANNPFVMGVLNVADWGTGRPLTSGSTISTCLTLGTNVNISKNFEGGAEFAAYSSCGDSIIDAYWGASQPYFSNPFTDWSHGTTGQMNSNYTKLSLDNFWLRHKPSKTQLTVGAFSDTNFDSFVYVPEVNPNNYGPKYLDSYGIQLKGEDDFGTDRDLIMRWEAMCTRLADGNISSIFPDYSYLTHAEGVNANLLFNDERGSLKFNFLHAANNTANGDGLRAGLIQSTNFTVNWVNPDGYYIGQMAGNPGAIAGMGSTSDERPIPMYSAVGNDGITGVPGVPNLGGIGPQDVITYGLSGGYEFDCTFKPRIYAEWAHSHYRPQKNSHYSVDGQALKAGLSIKTFDDTLDLETGYIQVDPTFDPFIIQYPSVGGIAETLWRTPGFTYFNSLYSLHNTEEYTHNRKGMRSKLSWKFCPTGRINFEYGNLSQVKTSMQDVRYSANSIAPGTPNTPVLGFSPGFLDPVFGGFSAATYASDGINEYAVPLENPRGKAENWGISAGLKYPLEVDKNRRCLSISGGARSTHFTRDSHLSELVPGPAGVSGESQNYVNLYINGWQAGIDYDITNNLSMSVGYRSIDIYGHLDHLGTMTDYAIASGSSRFDVLNLEQRIPNISVKWEVSPAITWGALGQFYQTYDRMREDIYSSPRIPGMNISWGEQHNSHPFDWQGYQVSTYMNFKF